MAFKFRSKSSLSIANKLKLPATTTTTTTSETTPDENNETSHKLTAAQINKLTKFYPAWIKDSAGLKQLPAIYQGVLGQVQLQPGYNLDDLQKATNKQLLLAQRQQQSNNSDYMNRFTDTERVHQLLSASQLSNETLATIWAHVNQTFPGKLTNREVCLALALIAIFQRLEKEGKLLEAKKDPFNLVKTEKKPPVPILYPSKHPSSPSNENKFTSTMRTSQSIPETLNQTTAKSDGLLIDIGEDGTTPFQDQTSQKQIKRLNGVSGESLATTRCINISKAISLIDMDGDRFELDFYRLIQSWLKFLSAIKATFKRSFDILNVENSRQSAIEALKHSQGQVFIKQLCLCYPLAHNIKFKIDELSKLRFPTNEQQQTLKANNKSNNSNIFASEQQQQKQTQEECLLDKNYIMQINDLINSINEYWAVLINLFHESGQTNFIELIMDGLNYKQSTVSGRTIGELANELTSLGKPNVCSLCHTGFYLTHSDFNDKGLTPEEIELVMNQEELLSLDKKYYYHAKCANFWLNHVDSAGLPFRKQPTQEEAILSPSS